MKYTSILLLAACLLCTGCQHKTQQTTNSAANSQTNIITAEDSIDAKYGADLLKPGTQAPELNLQTITDKPFSLRGLRGSYVVLEFWASWCPDCRRDLPDMVRLSKEFMPQGVRFVGISHDTEKEKWAAAIEKYGITYTQISDLKNMRESEAAQSFGVHWIPTYYLIDPDGRVALATVSFSKLEKACRSLYLQHHEEIPR